MGALNVFNLNTTYVAIPALYNPYQ